MSLKSRPAFFSGVVIDAPPARDFQSGGVEQPRQFGLGKYMPASQDAFLTCIPADHHVSVNSRRKSHVIEDAECGLCPSISSRIVPMVYIDKNDAAGTQ